MCNLLVHPVPKNSISTIGLCHEWALVHEYQKIKLCSYSLFFWGNGVMGLEENHLLRPESGHQISRNPSHLGTSHQCLLAKTTCQNHLPHAYFVTSTSFPPPLSLCYRDRSLSRKVWKDELSSGRFALKLFSLDNACPYAIRCSRTCSPVAPFGAYLFQCKLKATYFSVPSQWTSRLLCST